MNFESEYIEEGINGTGTGVVDVNSTEFKALQKAILAASAKLSPEQKIRNHLFGIMLRMKSYVDTDNAEIIEIGIFLRDFINALQIKNKDFAEYIGYQESNLSALFSGKRKINGDLALKFGSIFKMDAALWIHVQSKNELLKMKAANGKAYEKYRLEDLLKKTMVA